MEKLTHIHHLCFSSLLFAVSLVVAMGTSSGALQRAVMACCVLSFWPITFGDKQSPASSCLCPGFSCSSGFVQEASPRAQSSATCTRPHVQTCTPPRPDHASTGGMAASFPLVQLLPEEPSWTGPPAQKGTGPGIFMLLTFSSDVLVPSEMCWEINGCWCSLVVVCGTVWRVIWISSGEQRWLRATGGGQGKARCSGGGGVCHVWSG